MAISRAQIPKQISKPGKKKKIKKVIKALKKASKSHAGQAKTLKKIPTSIPNKYLRINKPSVSASNCPLASISKILEV